MTVREIARMFASVPHVWEGRGIHEWAAGDPQNCPACEALDAILYGSEHDDEQQTLQRFWERGLVFATNLAFLHPRGYALGVAVDDDGQVTRMFVDGDGQEPWVFADDVLDTDVFDRFMRFERERYERAAND